MGYATSKSPVGNASAGGTTHCWDDVRGVDDSRSTETVKRQARSCREYFMKEFGKEVGGCEKCPHLQPKCYIRCGVAMKFHHLRGDFGDNGLMHSTGRAITEAESIVRTLDEINSQESYENRRIDETSDFSSVDTPFRTTNGMVMNVSSGYDDGSDD